MLISIIPPSRHFHIVDCFLEIDQSQVEKDIEIKERRPQNERTNKTVVLRKVLFNLERTKTHEFDQGSPDEIKSRWYRVEELKSFRKSVIGLGRTASKRNGILPLMKDMYLNGQVMKHENLPLHESVSLCKSISSKHSPEKAYINLVEENHEILGLERFALDSAMKNDRRLRRRKILEIIHGYWPKHNDMTSSVDVDELIRKSCEPITRSSQAFAHRLAMTHLCINV